MASTPKTRWQWLIASTLCLSVIAYSAMNEADPSVSDSEIMPKADRSLLLDIAKTDSGFVAVGERGHVILSENGQNWTQVLVPSRSTLTTVSSVGSKIWAAGHDGVILFSADSGKTWTSQRANPWSADSQETTNGSPIIDSLFLDENTGFMVGAYSLLLKTTDAGTTWNAISVNAVESNNAAQATADSSGVFSDSDLALDAESNPHLNAIARTKSGALIVMGERGAGYRSLDNGDTWQKIKLPYGGSMFGVLSLGQEKLIAFGLRGNAYESSDAGSNWQKVETGAEFSLLGGNVNSKGDVVLVGSNGSFIIRRAAETAFTTKHLQLSTGQTPALTMALADDTGYLLTADLGHIHFNVQ